MSAEMDGGRGSTWNMAKLQLYLMLIVEQSNGEAPSDARVCHADCDKPPAWLAFARGRQIACSPIKK